MLASEGAGKDLQTLASEGANTTSPEGENNTFSEGERRTRTRRPNPRYFESDWTTIARWQTQKVKAGILKKSGCEFNDQMTLK